MKTPERGRNISFSFVIKTSERLLIMVASAIDADKAKSTAIMFFILVTIFFSSENYLRWKKAITMGWSNSIFNIQKSASESQNWHIHEAYLVNWFLTESARVLFWYSFFGLIWVFPNILLGETNSKTNSLILGQVNLIRGVFTTFGSL